MKRKLYNLVAVLLVGIPVVFTSFAQSLIQGIQVEAKEFETYEGEKLVELKTEITPDNSITVTNEDELIEAVNDPDILEIISNSSVVVSKPLKIDREITFGGYSQLTFSREGSLTITSTGKLTLSSIFIFKGETSAEALVTIDGGELRTVDPSISPFTGIALNQTGDISTFIEIKNDGLFINNAYLRIGEINNVNKLEIFMKMNGGTFIDTPSTILTGEVIADRAIVSETGLNSHEFVYSGVSGGDTALTSRRGNQVYTNHEEATLVVNGAAPQLAAWMIESEDPSVSLMHTPPDFSLGNFSFKVEQVGEARPMIHEISNSAYNHLFFNGIFSMFKGFRSADAATVFPPIRLPEEITVSPAESNLLIGETVQLNEKLSPDPSQLDTAEVIWTSENPEIAKVDGHGHVTATGKGETEIKVTTVNGLSATAEIKVEDFTFEFTGVDGNSTAIVTGYYGTDTEIEIPSTTVNLEAGWTTSSTVVGIADRVFMDKGLTNVLIPNSVTEIGENAFYRNKLNTVTIPDTVTSIGQQAFLENNLTSLHIGSGVSRLENQVFGLNNLSSIVIPDTIQQIETLAFHSNNLTEVTVPKTIKHLGLRAFENNSLEKVTFSGEITGLGAQVFAQNPLKEIHVEEGSLVHYQRELSPNIIRGVTEKTVLTVDEPRYSEDTQLFNNLMVGDELSFSVLSKNRYQLTNLEAFVWEEFIPNVEWFKDAEALPTETKQQFKIAEVEESDSGSYFAIVDGSELPSLSVEVSPLIQPDIPAINPEDGILELENTNPVIEGLSLRYVSDLYFDAVNFSASNQTVYANNNGEVPIVTVQDMRSTSQRNGWELRVRQNQLFMDGAELIFNPFVHEINQDTLNIKAHGGALTVNTEEQRFAGTTTENPSGIATMGVGSVDGSGVSLQIPGGVGVGSYGTTLIWNLVAGPSVQ